MPNHLILKKSYTHSGGSYAAAVRAPKLALCAFRSIPG